MNRGTNNILKTKGFYIALVAGICMIAVLGYTITGIQTASDRLNKLNQAKNEMDNMSNDISSNFEVADNTQKESEGDTIEDEDKGDLSQEETVIQNDTATQEIAKSEEESNENLETTELAKATEENDNTSKEEVNEEVSMEKTSSQVNDEPKTVEVIGTDNVLNNLSFNEESGLAWPVNGNVIKNYSVDSLVYFKTLGQFKSNPAIFIESNVGTKVNAACDGVVTNIYESTEFGNVVEVSIGNEYVLTYGQLENICVANGDKIGEGDEIGCIAKPTGYYSQEGSHLYFKVEQNDSSVNPLLLLR